MKTRRLLNGILLAVGCAVVVTVSTAGTGARQATGQSVSIDATTSAASSRARKGPRPASGSSPRRPTFRTKFVQDRRHRRPGSLPDSRSAEGEATACGCAATGWSTRRRSDARRADAEPDGGARADAARGGGVLPGRLLVLAAQGAGQERVPRHRPERQRHRADHREPGAVAAQSEVRRLHGVPPARHARDARDARRPRARFRRRRRRGSGGCSPVRPAAR